MSVNLTQLQQQALQEILQAQNEENLLNIEAMYL
jgi:hypothetical protein